MAVSFSNVPEPLPKTPLTVIVPPATTLLETGVITEEGVMVKAPPVWTLNAPTGFPPEVTVNREVVESWTATEAGVLIYKDVVLIWSGVEFARPIEPLVSPIARETPLTTSVWANALMPVVPHPTIVTLPEVLVTEPPRVTLPLFAAAAKKMLPLDPSAPLVVMLLKAEKLIGPVEVVVSEVKRVPNVLGSATEACPPTASVTCGALRAKPSVEVPILPLALTFADVAKMPVLPAISDMLPAGALNVMELVLN